MTLIYKTHTRSAAETAEAGRKTAELIDKNGYPSFICLEGDLGAGKTEFCRGAATYFVPGAAVRSPSFNIVNEYRSGKRNVFHFDFYRLTSAEDLISVGFYDYPEDSVFLVEWASKLKEELPSSRVEVLIKSTDGESGGVQDGERDIEVRLCE